ncbi:MAG: Crp/Fnr family transcriptional regulator [Candidatus Zixiibacteriota bacterium]
MQHFLSRSQLFSQLDPKALAEVADAAAVRETSRQEMIFFEGEIAHAFYVVGKGKVKIFKMSPDGKEQILMIAGPGDSFAEAALFAGGKYPASAQALEDSTLAVIARDKFVALLGRNPDIAVNLIARLSGLLRKMTALVEELSLTDVTTRLAHYLIGLVSQTPPQAVGYPSGARLPEGRRAERSRSVPDAGTVTITLSEKKAVMASQLGTIPETLSRSFARLTREKVIAIDGPKIEILDLVRLKELAGGE